MKNLNMVFATDFTKASDNAIKYGLKFSQQFAGSDVKSYLVHAFKKHVPYMKAPVLPVLDSDGLKDKLSAKLKDQASEISDYVQCEPILKRGSTAEVFDELINKKDIDCIVMGTRQKSDFIRQTLGTHTANVSNKIDRPVLAVPEGIHFNTIKNITLTADYEPLSISNESLAFIKKIASDKQINFNVLHVFDDNEKGDLKEKMEKTALHRYLSDVKHRHLPITNSNVFDGIIEHMRNDQPDILIAIPRKRSFLEELFHSSITEKMIYHTKLPVLVV